MVRRRVMAKSSKRRQSIERQIKSLQMRVAHLERPLITERQRQKNQKFWADFEKRSAEIEARSKVMREYHDAEREQRLVENPNALRIAIEQERKENAFLKSKGLKPNPSKIPPTLRRTAKGRAEKSSA